jgi:hypothetical protein
MSEAAKRLHPIGLFAPSMILSWNGSGLRGSLQTKFENGSGWPISSPSEVLLFQDCDVLEKVLGLANTLSPSEIPSKSHCGEGSLAGWSRLTTEESSPCPPPARGTFFGIDDDAERKFERSRKPSDGRLPKLDTSDCISVARSLARFEDGPGPLFVRRMRSLSCEKSHTKVQSLPVFVQFEHGPRGNVPR